MSATATETTEQKRDRLAGLVFDADAAWYADIENDALKAAYKAAKTTFRDFENAALDAGASETCSRCGGAGGWRGWPGFTCFRCGGHGREPMRKTKFQAVPTTRLKKEAEAQTESDRREQAYKAACADLGDLGASLDAARIAVHAWNYDSNDPEPSREHYFRAGLADKLYRFGSLSDAQIDAARKGLEREAADTAEKAAAGPLAEGEYEITGEIVSTRWQDGGQYGPSLKMLVKLDNGNKVWGTKPSRLDADKGDRIAFTAEVKRSDDDEHFGFFSRPKGARLAEEPMA